MSLVNYQKHFDNAYEEVFNKVLVAKEIMNTRFESKLKFGASVERFVYDVSAVRVRTVSRGSASTIDTVSDSSELLTVNIEKEAAFHISDGEVTQAGPLNPGTVIGKQIGFKVASDLDGRCFAEIKNAAYAFDNGDLTTGSSTGTAITLSSTTVPQLTSRLGAKLRNKNNQEITTNMVFVVDSYAASDITQYILGKNIDLAGNVFKNGYTGDVSNAQLYVSENLPSTATLVYTGSTVNNEAITINGVTFTAVTTIGTTPGNVLASATDSTTFITNITSLINNPSLTNANHVALSTANQDIISNISATATSSTVLTIEGRSGRLVLTEAQTNATWATNILHGYFGKRGAIDLVIQDMKSVDMRKTDDRRGTNVFSSYLAGIKTFADGSKKFLNVKILVA